MQLAHCRVRPGVLRLWFQACLPLLACGVWLEIGVAAGSADPAPAGPVAGPHRWLLVVENSRAMQRRSENIANVTRDFLDTSLRNQLRAGDEVAVWTISESLSTNAQPWTLWSAENRPLLSVRILTHLQGMTYERRIRLPALIPQLDALVRDSQLLTVVMLTSGEGEMTGTPYDAAINEAWVQWRGEQGSSRQPICTMLRAVRGQIVRWAVSPAPWPLEIPPLPPRAAPGDRVIPAITPAAAPTNPPSLAFTSPPPALAVTPPAAGSVINTSAPPNRAEPAVAPAKQPESMANLPTRNLDVLQVPPVVVRTNPSGPVASPPAGVVSSNVAPAPLVATNPAPGNVPITPPAPAVEIPKPVPQPDPVEAVPAKPPEPSVAVSNPPAIIALPPPTATNPVPDNIPNERAAVVEIPPLAEPLPHDAGSRPPLPPSVSVNPTNPPAPSAVTPHQQVNFLAENWLWLLLVIVGLGISGLCISAWLRTMILRPRVDLPPPFPIPGRRALPPAPAKPPREPGKAETQP